MPKNFDKYFGYSDHVIGLEGCFLAISRGANLIEKHFTLDKTSKVIRDHALSATPDEFKILVDQGRKIKVWLMCLKNKNKSIALFYQDFIQIYGITEYLLKKT